MAYKTIGARLPNVTKQAQCATTFDGPIQYTPIYNP